MEKFFYGKWIPILISLLIELSFLSLFAFFQNLLIDSEMYVVPLVGIITVSLSICATAIYGIIFSFQRVFKAVCGKENE